MSRIIDQVLSYHLKCKFEDIIPHFTLETYGCDELDIIEIVMDLEDKFGVQITDSELEELRTIKDVYDIINRKQDEKQKHLTPPAPAPDENPKE